MNFNSKHVLIGLLAFTVIASGCLNGETEETPEPAPEPEPEPAPEPDEEPESPEDEVNETDEEEVNETEEEDEVRTVEITGFSDNSYDVDNVDVEEGETVEFVYVHDGGQHDLVLERDGEDVESTEILSESGEEDSFTYTFEEDGEYEFYCSVGQHRDQGMEGTVTVE